VTLGGVGRHASELSEQQLQITKQVCAASIERKSGIVHDLEKLKLIDSPLVSHCRRGHMGSMHHLHQALPVIPLRPGVSLAPILSDSILSHGSGWPFLLRYSSGHLSPVSTFASQLGRQDTIRLWKPNCRVGMDRCTQRGNRHCDPRSTNTMRLESATAT